ncbi:MAG: xanthan lyase [Bacteroidaceae bacterium]|nr:xanthan lyase [Bacteroidaceae bacterium]
MKIYYSFLILIITCLPLQKIRSQVLPGQVRTEVTNFLTEISTKEVCNTKIHIEGINIKSDLLIFDVNADFSYIPFREDNVAKIYQGVRALLPRRFSKYKLVIRTDKQPIEDLIPLTLRNEKDKKIKVFANTSKVPLITRISVPYAPSCGLQNKHIAMWQSHGLYYNSSLDRWEWQRARIFETVEDLYTQSYVLPFLVPMLENAGATVLLPRERDTQTEEIIIDNDRGLKSNSVYSEHSGKYAWLTGSEKGFAHLKEQYKDFENPFKDGTYRQTLTVKNGNKNSSRIEWIPDIPESGKYAVYISYKTVKNSTDDALYTVYHKGEITSFRVNQQMGGSTWIYLGTFNFNQGKSSDKIVLSNSSHKSNRIITADAIKIGGGHGNIARGVPSLNYPEQTSGYPRFCEGARYWLQWAGMPDSIYSDSHGETDYSDDYKSRGKWVNYLAGGSIGVPDENGLNIPINMALAFHSDAGTFYGDSIVGTLGIFQTDSYNGTFANGSSRYASRDLTDLVMSSITNDIRKLYEPNWSRRGMKNKSYYEARVPRVPTMLLELLSHQNFADMRYGLDPRFRFTVSRAIYKGILQFLYSQGKTKHIVQPLPVNHLSLGFTDDHQVRLSWSPVNDPLEPTAQAKRYIVYSRIGNNDFDNGTVVKGTTYECPIPTNKVCSFKVTALNEGGESFPSEILSAGVAKQTEADSSSYKTVLIINGFDRISAPADFDAKADSLAGFLDQWDHGVPYIKDISYVGRMKEFRRKIPWTNNDASGFGDSYATYEKTVIAGNTFDYPAIHGEAILKSGDSFTSCSKEAVEDGLVNLKDYHIVDLILGKECQTKMGRGGVTPLKFKTFDKTMQNKIKDYCQAGGSFFVSGAFVGTDLWANGLTKPIAADAEFATGTLKYKWRTGRAALNDTVKCVHSPFTSFAGNYSFYNKPNSKSYVVESPDAIEPASKDAYTIFRYTENNLSAGIAYKGYYKTCVLGFPFESLRTKTEREELMKSILDFFKR